MHLTMVTMGRPSLSGHVATRCSAWNLCGHCASICWYYDSISNRPEGEEAASVREAAPAVFPVFRSRLTAAVLARTYIGSAWSSHRQAAGLNRCSLAHPANYLIVLLASLSGQLTVNVTRLPGTGKAVIPVADSPDQPGKPESDRAERPAYSVDEAAQLTGLSRDLLYDEMRRGNLAYIKIGRRRLITRHHLQQFLADASS